MYGFYEESKRLGVGALTSDQAFQTQGVQFLQPGADGQVKNNLANLFLTGQMPAPVEGAAHFNAVAKQVAEQNNGDLTRSALDALKDRPVGSVVLVNPTSASGSFVDVFISTTPEATTTIAGPGTDFAVLDLPSMHGTPEPAPKKKEKKKTTPMLVGAAAGAGIGFIAAGPPGALIGAGAGAVGGALVG